MRISFYFGKKERTDAQISLVLKSSSVIDRSDHRKIEAVPAFSSSSADDMEIPLFWRKKTEILRFGRAFPPSTTRSSQNRCFCCFFFSAQNRIFLCRSWNFPCPEEKPKFFDSVEFFNHITIRSSHNRIFLSRAWKSPRKHTLSRFDPTDLILRMPFSFLLFRNCYIHLLLFSFLAALPFITATVCNRTCGGSKNLVPYPFGFSDGCHIRLSCTNQSAFSIGLFNVRSVTHDSIVVDLPAKCNRSIESIKNLWGSNYALTWKNGFLLRNCSSSQLNCLVPSTQLGQRFGLTNCSEKPENISCFSKEGDGFMSYENVTETKCRFLISSYAVDSSKNPVVSLDFQTVELEWWLEGRSCGQGACYANANCTDVRSPRNGTHRYRCTCPDGFKGDGFIGGQPCRKGERNIYLFILHFLRNNFKNIPMIFPIHFFKKHVT